MPQTLEESWKVELGEKFNEIHTTYLHNIGNLILTEFNSEIGNKAFEEKKRKLETSSLNYRLDIISRNIWNEESIKEHQSNMITWFLATFPLEDQYKEKANWNTQRTDSTVFSPLDTDAGDIAEGEKPIELHINEDIIVVRSWQDVFILFLKYLRDNPEFDFEFILDNQSELFRREDTIIRCSALKDLIAFNFDLSTRYKTFEGKVLDKLKEIDENTLFIHINFKAATCMSRISSIMDKFNMPLDSVVIKLK
jgi:hypothetical protein